ncbi:hypothetical protein VTN31DRAFT_3850 [Thermomyces dupontii]|uniref:uncharacterized protein n=1 Tax=Talaromyces thermophilus TaxID=28565 RepID=UPI003743A5FE
MAFPESVSAGMLAGSECRDDLSGDTFDDISLLSSDEEDDRSPAFFLAQAEKQEGQEKQQRLYAERTRQRLDSVMRSWEWYGTENQALVIRWSGPGLKLLFPTGTASEMGMTQRSGSASCRSPSIQTKCVQSSRVFFTGYVTGAEDQMGNATGASGMRRRSEP